MQQVKSESFLAGARMVYPRVLPVSVRSSRCKLRNNLGRIWVLHRSPLRRGMTAIALLAVIGGLCQMREHVRDGATVLADMVQGRFVDAGFVIGEISITGQALTGEQALLSALDIGAQTSTIGFDVEAARQRIANLPAIDTVSIRKSYPGAVIVQLTEKVPVARWRVDGITFLIDASGERIGEDRGVYDDLPLVIGDGANDDAMAMIRALNQFPELESGLVAVSRIADRRWDLIYDTGLRVQLPEMGVVQALRNLSNYQQHYQLLDRDVTVIDLRIDSLVAVRPARSEEETRAR